MIFNRIFITDIGTDNKEEKKLEKERQRDLIHGNTDLLSTKESRSSHKAECSQRKCLSGFRRGYLKMLTDGRSCLSI